MRVEKLLTTHFRNLDHPEIFFAPGINLFVGENGQGKTNLLEAVSVFKFGRSFRTHRDTEVIRFGEPYCRAETSCVFADGHAESYSMSVEKGGNKRFKVSGEPIGKLSDLIGRYPVVLFGPQDLKLISGHPQDRRRFVDMVGSMTEPTYIKLLKNYRQILNHRNAVLKRGARHLSRSELDAWNAHLVDKGCELIDRRRVITAIIERYLLEHANDLDTPFEFSLEYDSVIIRESAYLADNGAEPGIEEMKAVFETKLLSIEREELKRGATLVGPHRDDVVVRLAGNDVRKYGSQGQRRLLAILLKLAELSHLEAALEEPCVLLLDDVFSEFDRGIIGRLQNLLESGRQVFITSPIRLDWAASRGVRMFSVDGGCVVPG